ncbi:peptidylprolyl isomerase [Colwellia chukchiensis]|uniref:peptidylprolyl isomerase n=1 Tax=Colwellia chukchiensis TaxID=641665 RepID=A0A1H7T2F9_9GAMM|nr:peptidylprolyl isomerase [Colwellia chukchiensis]SEL78456.1 peptidylprolyl isomerase [Colwellia chukchiensis]
MKFRTLSLKTIVLTSVFSLSYGGLVNAEQNVQAQMMAKIAADNAKQKKDEWRTVALENMVLLTLPHGEVVIELAPQFSPKHVQQFSRLIQSGHYDGNKFYRVIDGFVAQAGPEYNSRVDRQVPLLALEGEWATDKDWSFTLVQSPDLFAEQTGFKDGFAIAHNVSEQKAWLAHCPGVVAMARGNDADSGSSHFYITIGQAPRYLDRIMSIFGRVIYGMQHVQALTRTAAIEGDKAVDSQQHTPIVSMKMMSDVAPEKQIHLQVKNTDSALFATKLAERLARKSAFFFKQPPQVLDVCQTPVLTRRIDG